MNCNGDSTAADDSVICLDTSVDSLITDDENKQITLMNETNLEKTLPPGVAPEGFIIVDETIEPDVDDGNESQSRAKDSPMFKVIFRDEVVLRQYQKQIKDFFQQLVAMDLTDNSNESELVMEIWGNPKHDTEKNIFNHMDDKNDLLFTIDNTPGSHDIYNIPTYGKKFEKVLKKSCTDSDSENKNDDASPRMNCFNCLGDHNLRDCTAPRNQLEIFKNRKEFTTRMGPRNTRYHVDDEQKYKPGVLSTELRKALGLEPDELPRHIFKMRCLGYPPGWLEDAKLEHSGLNLYNSEGNRERDPSEEVGEIFIPESKVQYDISKLHDFPGFNIPAPPSTRDAFWSPDQQLFHSKETMLTILSSSKADEGYKRKKLKITTGEPSPNDSVETVAMDVELLEDGVIESTPENGHFAQPLPKSPVHTESIVTDSDIIELPLHNSTKIDTCEVSSRANSPSLSDLESKKKLLLEALDDSSSQSNPGTPVKAAMEPLICETPTSSITNISQSTPIQSSSIESTPKHGSVKSVEFGTPILQNTSIYTKLPSSEKFSKDICDVINFENLPGATGMFEKINGILHKVRDVLGNTEQDD